MLRVGFGSSVSDILIVGGGFAGAVSALAIADQRRRITVLESSVEAPRFSGDLIQPLGRQLLADIGVLPLLLSRGAAPIHGFAVFPGLPSCGGLGTTPGNGFATLPYGKIGGECAQGLAMNSCALVRSVQAEASARAGIDLHLGIHAVDVLRRDGRVVGVRDADGREWLAKLTLVAQGRHAPLRRKLGLDGKPRVLSISTALTLHGVPLPVPNYAHIFLDPGGQGGGPVLAHPIGGGETRISVDLPPFAGGGKPLAYRILNGHVRHLPSDLAEALHLTLGRANAEEQLETRATCAFRYISLCRGGRCAGRRRGGVHTSYYGNRHDHGISRCEDLTGGAGSSGRFAWRSNGTSRPRTRSLSTAALSIRQATRTFGRSTSTRSFAARRAARSRCATACSDIGKRARERDPCHWHCSRVKSHACARSSPNTCGYPPNPCAAFLGNGQGGLRDGGFPVPRCDLSALSDVLGKCFETFGRCTRGAMSLRPGRFDCRPSVALSP